MQLYPTRRAIVFAALGAPVALVIAVALPQAWAGAAAWIVLTAGLMLADVLLAASPASLSLAVRAPAAIGLGRSSEAVITAAFVRGAPASLEVALGTDERLEAAPERQWLRLAGRQGEARAALKPLRRGESRLQGAWARWRGPLGFMWLQRTLPAADVIAVTPDVQRVKEQALQLFSRDALFGLKAQMERGEGGDFHALTDFSTGMDLRAIDWKQSARHAKLVAREYRTERNHLFNLTVAT